MSLEARLQMLEKNRAVDGQPSDRLFEGFSTEELKLLIELWEPGREYTLEELRAMLGKGDEARDS